MNIGRLKRRVRLAWWAVTGGKRAPEVDAGDIAVVHPDAMLARKALLERQATARASSLALSASSALPGSVVLIGDPDADPSQERLVTLGHDDGLVSGPQITALDVKSLRAAPDGTVVEVASEPWTKFGTLWFPGKWTTVNDALIVGSAALNSARLAHRATTLAQTKSLTPDDAGTVLVSEAATPETIVVPLPEDRPDDAPWVR